MKRLLLLSLLICSTVIAQDIPAPKLPKGVTILNQTKASYDLEKKISIFEDWFNLDYRYENFSAGIRYESFYRTIRVPLSAEERKNIPI
ncbi:hypothetical protein MASR1M107_28090 [Ignavibacteriales bacterium]